MTTSLKQSQSIIIIIIIIIIINHIVSGCEVLAKTEYISRHNNAAAYLHWSICKDHDIEITDKWYEHEPETVIHNKAG